MSYQTTKLFKHSKNSKRIFYFSDSENNGLPQCLLHVYIDSCHGLQSSKRFESLSKNNLVKMDLKYVCNCFSLFSYSSSKSKSKVELRVGQSGPKSISFKNGDSAPIFDKEFTLLVNNPNTEDLNIEVIDANEKVIGNTNIPIFDLLNQPDMEYSCQQFELKHQG